MGAVVKDEPTVEEAVEVATRPIERHGADVEADNAAETVGEARRDKLGLPGELLLAVLPVVTVLLVLWLIEAVASRQVLFASLASSAFLIYRDPTHRMNSLRALLLAQGLAAVAGFAALEALGPGYLAAGLAVIAATFAMIALDAVHPPAMGTALSFAFRPNDDSNFVLFGIALLMVAVLTGLSVASTRLVRYLEARGKLP